MKNFLAGLGVGAALGLMLAPEAGEETRKKLQQRLGNVRKAIFRSRQLLGQAGWRGSSNDGQGTGEEQAARDPNAPPKTLLEVLNTASKTRLISVRGIGDATARRIIEGRPYNSVN